MKKLIFILLIPGVPAFSFAANNDFSYDKTALEIDFSQLNKLDATIDETNVSFIEFPKDFLLECKRELFLTDSLKTQTGDKNAFALGLCCWPLGCFTILLNGKKDKNSKESFGAGAIISIVADILIIAFINNLNFNYWA